MRVFIQIVELKTNITTNENDIKGVFTVRKFVCLTGSVRQTSKSILIDFNIFMYILRISYDSQNIISKSIIIND